MTKLQYIILFLCGTYSAAQAQYAPQATVAGSDAIHKSSSQFVGWATTCSIQRGYMDIAQPGLGYATLGDSTNALGDIDNTVVSLGDSGVATLTFGAAVYNGPGPDFAVFENGFADPADAEQAFLELAFVEVSSDGVNFTRFPASSLIPTTTQIPAAGVYTNARQINNLAGKYISNYGTPFDLQELAGTPGLDIDNITHVRLVDVIGDIGTHASTDKDGNPINDPYSTPFPSSGFDLDGVGAIHLRVASSVANTTRASVSIYPNPSAGNVTITNSEPCEVILTDLTGKLLWHSAAPATNHALRLDGYNAGTYLLNIINQSGKKWTEKLVKY